MVRIPSNSSPLWIHLEGFNDFDTVKLGILDPSVFSNGMRNLAGVIGTEVEAEKRMEVLAALRNIDHIHSMDWLKRQKQMGITIDGVWKEQPNDVKQEFLSHFQDRFAKPSERRANIDMRFQKLFLKNKVRTSAESSKQEIKRRLGLSKQTNPPGP
ncbi:hypothetical protein Tco_0285417 [Tanacetum coccineum]